MSDSHYRHEFKYLVSSAQIPLLKSRIAGSVRQDPHAGSAGMYTVRSLYFDSLDNRCFHENENGTDPREKFRIRLYNGSLNRITLECKRKEHGMTQKTACPLSREQAQSLISGWILPEAETLPPLLRKLDLKRKTELYRPVVIVEYERFPFVCRDGNVRVTFDCALSSCSCPDDFFSPRIRKRPVMPAGMHLMEVKYDAFLPDVIYRGLNLGSLRQTSFSKYFLCRKYMIY